MERGGALKPYPMICLEIIDLFPENKHPEVFAEELDHVQRLREAWAIARESAQEKRQQLLTAILKCDAAAQKYTTECPQFEVEVPS